MYTLYKMNSDDLNENFIAAIKAQYPHQTIEIAVSDIDQLKQDETECLLSDPGNKAHLLAAIQQVEQNHLIDVDLENL